MKIEDYIHYYLGCEAITSNGTRIVITGVYKSGNNLFVKYVDVGSDFNGLDGSVLINKIQLLLRPLKSMNRKQFNHLIGYEYWSDIPNDINDWFGARAKMIKELLDQRFDLFGLIEAGLAIDATTMPNSITERTRERRNGR
jgi:hypothetical protein